MMNKEKIKNSNELEFAVFCIENLVAKLGVDAIDVYKALTKQSDILYDYIIPEYEVLHTQSKEYIVEDILVVMKERGVDDMIFYHESFLEVAKPDLMHSRPNLDFGRGFYVTPLYEQAEKWLDFILNCRTGKDSTDYDLVVGGIANDKVFNTI